MRVVVAGAVVLACGLGCLAGPLSAAASPVTARVRAAAEPVTRITLDLGQGGRIYDGVGGVLGGGGNARYLMDYPAAQRQQILKYLFKPDYGASLQILKLEIGGDADTSDGAEPSIEHTRGHINCHAGYELAIAKQAVRLNPGLRLYALQWAAPGWVGQRGGRFTTRDIGYLLDWLGCARRQGLRISYLGGWSESDSGKHQNWWRSLRAALDHHGYRQVRLVAPDSTGANKWHYVGDSAIAVLGAHNACGKTSRLVSYTMCTSPWSANSRRDRSSQPMWNSESGKLTAGATSGCTQPCAPALDRAVIRGFVDARLTGFLEWPVVDAMPASLPYENRGLVTADEPWSGSYQVNALTWATAQLTQFAAPPGPGGRVVWRYVSSAGGWLDGRTADGSYVSLVRTNGGPASAWSTMIEATTATTTQRASFHITGGRLARATVHVWASNFDPSTDGPGQWFVRQPVIHPNKYGRFSLVIRPGWVYSLTTTTGQGKGTAASARLVSAPAADREPGQRCQGRLGRRRAGLPRRRAGCLRAGPLRGPRPRRPDMHRAGGREHARVLAHRRVPHQAALSLRRDRRRRLGQLPGQRRCAAAQPAQLRRAHRPVQLPGGDTQRRRVRRLPVQPQRHRRLEPDPQRQPRANRCGLGLRAGPDPAPDPRLRPTGQGPDPEAVAPPEPVYVRLHDHGLGRRGSGGRRGQ